MSSSLDLVDLLEASTKVTDWYTFGVYLKMPSEELQDIEGRCSRDGIKRCKIELFTSWMKRYPNASWADVARALGKCNENTTADQIRQFHLPPSLPATTASESQNSSSQGDNLAQKTQVLRPKEVVAQFRKLESSYAELTFNLKTSLDEKQVLPMKLGRFLIGLLEEDPQDHDKLLQATTIDKLFQLISPYYCFLSTAVLRAIIDKFIGEPLKHQLEEYERQLEEFKESTSMDLLKEIEPQSSPSAGAPQVIIKLAKCWERVTIRRFERLVKQIFEENSTSLTNITVKSGCISVTWFTRKSSVPSLVAQAQEKTAFMKLVGILRMSISEIDILKQEEEEDTSFLISSALDQATRADCADAVMILLSILEADPNSSDSEGFTPLMIACSYGNIRITTLLLQAHANINQQNNDGYTALMAACDSETPQYELVKLMVQSGADLNIKTSQLQRTALMAAAECGHTSIVRYLLDEGAPVNTQDVNGSTSLMIASVLGHSEVVCVLINYGADLNILAKGLDDATALMYACDHQRTVCVDLLLAGGADPNLCSREHSPLIDACIIDDYPMDPTILEKLLSAGANPNTQTGDDGLTALMQAAADGYEKGIEVLLKAGADVSIQDSNGLTALHCAAEYGHLAVCKTLLASGAQVSVTDNDGDTPLDLALNNDHHEVCELLRSIMDSDPSHTTQETVTTQPSLTAQEINKPVQDCSQSRKKRSKNIPSLKLRRGILPSITSVGRLFRNLLLPDREIKLRHSNQTQQPNIPNNN